jgi:cyclopropane fatty-acyl-phospholipid synthase-like methyltransferase
MVHSADTYKLFADYYDLYVEKFKADLDFYSFYCKKTDDILEVGCGTGRILTYLLEEGYTITGIDISQEMLDKAHLRLEDYEKSGHLKLLNFNLVDSQLSETYDKIFITFYTFNYIIKEPVKFFKNVFDCLKDDGLLLIDLFYPKSMADNKTDGKWTEQKLNIDNQQIIIKDCRKLVKNIEYRTQVYCENGREITIETERKYYPPDEIKTILQSAGFKEILFSSTYSNCDFSLSINPNELKSNFVVSARK